MSQKKKPVLFNWLLLFALSLLLYEGLHQLRLPAALLLGPMLAAVILSIREKPVRMHNAYFQLGQAFVGISIAGQLPATVFEQVSSNWTIFFCGAMFTIVAAATLGWALSKSGLFPGNTAIWGTSPGAAAAMTVLSESFGEDIRLVALMQYLRVLGCTLSATFAGKYLGGPAAHLSNRHLDLFHISSPRDFAWTLAIIFGSYILVCVWKKPGLAFVLPMIIGMAAKMLGCTQIVLPGLLIATAYGLIGWNIGLRFNRPILRYAAKLLPYILLSIFLLITVNAAFALVLVKWAGVSFLTAFLATSPGGADSVSIIAASIPADVSFVVAMQVIRFFLVILISPMLARWLSTPKTGTN